MAVSPPKPCCHTFGSYSFKMSAVLQVFNALFWNLAEQLFSFLWSMECNLCKLAAAIFVFSQYNLSFEYLLYFGQLHWGCTYYKKFHNSFLLILILPSALTRDLHWCTLNVKQDRVDVASPYFPALLAHGTENLLWKRSPLTFHLWKSSLYVDHLWTGQLGWVQMGAGWRKHEKKKKLTDHSSYSTTSQKHHFNTAMTLKDNPVVTNTSNKQFPVPVSSVKHLENHSFQSSHQPPQKMPQLV